MSAADRSACIDPLEHSRGVVPGTSNWEGISEFLLSADPAVQQIAAEFPYGMRVAFIDGVRFVVGYTHCHEHQHVSLLMSPMCPQCHGSEAAADDAVVSMFDPAKLRASVAGKRH